MTAAPYRFSREGRSLATLLAVVAVWVCALGAWLAFDAALWLVGVVLIFTLPALWDLYAAPVAGVELGREGLGWYSGPRRADVALDEIEHVRLVTRLDLSVRAAVVLTSGRKLRLPPEATPPSKPFEAALAAHGVRTERHHFSFL